MMKTQFVYMGRKPSLASRRELLELMPVLDIEYIPYDGGDIETENRFGYLTIKWDWLRSFFDAPDIACLSLQKADIKEAGITKHWGFYSLDSDLDHQFYITDLGDKLDARAKANGFKTNMAWMFCHEFLHGHVWGRTRNVLASAQSVHAWEEQGKLKEHLAEAMESYQTQETLIEKLLALVGLLKKYQAYQPEPTDILPLVKRKAESVVSEMKKLGHEVRIVQGFRSKEEQDALYAKGRTSPGAIVTNAKAGESFHNYGVAVDFVFRREGYNASSTLWNKLGQVGKNQGFEWGGDWTGFVDRPHFEMKLGYSLKDFQKGTVDYDKFS